jgi:hypothetical protein
MTHTLNHSVSHSLTHSGVSSHFVYKICGLTPVFILVRTCHMTYDHVFESRLLHSLSTCLMIRNSQFSKRINWFLDCTVCN